MNIEQWVSLFFSSCGKFELDTGASPARVPASGGVRSLLCLSFLFVRVSCGGICRPGACVFAMRVSRTFSSKSDHSNEHDILSHPRGTTNEFFFVCYRYNIHF
jgi:hypothetical protein